MTTQTKTMKIEDLARWSAPRRVETKNGPRDLRTAPPTETFWTAWKQSKDSLRAAGISVGKNRQTGDWEACWWLPINAAEQRQLEESRELSRAKDANVEVPAPAGLDYLPYQRAGIAYAATRPAVLIGDEMGLGKTIQAIGIFNADASIKTVLVVCPASLRLNWKREFERWAVRPVRVAVVSGGKAADWRAAGADQADVVIVNYDIAGKHRDRIDAREWDLLIGDEIHFCKNPDAQRTRAIFGHRTKKGEVKQTAIWARRRVFLTGTPIVNRPAELWPLVQALDPEGLGRSFFGFAKRYCAAERNRWGWDFSGASNLDELQRKLRERFMVRRLKADVLAELPPKRRQVVELPANGAAGAVAEELRIWESHREYIEQLELELAEAERECEGLADADEFKIEQIRRRLGKAKAVAFEEMSRARHAVAVAKAPKVAEAIREELEEIESVVVFAHHRDVVEILRSELADLGVVTVTGETTMEDRQAAVDAFQAGAVRVFIGNIQAAGVGLTLTRSADVRFAELDWVPGNLDQAEDRCHRIGQTGSVLVKHYVLEGSLDSYMVDRIIQKQGVIRAALDEQVEQPKPLAGDAGAEVPAPTPEVVRELRVEVAPAEEPKTTPEQREAILAGLRRLAGVCDGARELDGAGFNKMDSAFGKSLAYQEELTDRQALAGQRLLRKYRRQLGDAILERAGVR